MNQSIPPSSTDVRPMVATGRSGNFGLLAFLIALPLASLWIFSALYRGDEISAPSTTFAAANPGERISAPPPLDLPPDYLIPQRIVVGRTPETLGPSPRPSALPDRGVLARTAPSFHLPQPLGTPVTGDRIGDVVVARPAEVFRHNAVDVVLAQGQTQDERIRAGRLANPSTTVPQGTVIPAVMETALDSTRPGAVRALVQRDVAGFDGSRVLIERGSRLYGVYDVGVDPGQRRALIRWTRLIRPDGVTIALDSPASDPLGRAGVEGDVDSHFLTRFGGAILQSVLDIGVGIATREATNGVILALPGSTQNAPQMAQTQQVQPVLRVEHGASVSVFVAHDLDFSSVER